MNTGLIIEGGGMRGIFAAGVLDYFLDNDIKFGNVIGVSAGACHGCSYVAGQRGRAYEVFTDYMDDKEYCSFHNLRTTGDLFGVEFIYHKVPKELNPIDNEAFLKSGINFQAVVTNCETGQAEYPVIKDLFKQAEYIRASASLPLLANMVELPGGLYMDGGIADSIPIEQYVKQGITKNVVILTRERSYRKGRSSGLPVIAAKYRDYPQLVKTLARRHKLYNDSLDFLRQEELAGRAFVIAPIGPLDIGRIERNEKKMRKGYIEGYYVAEGLSERIDRKSVV